MHVRRVEVGWGQCDPAGIVYFPRFFEMFHDAMESWFGRDLQMPYDEVILGRKLGFPAVHTQADFERPTRFGETIAVELRVAHVGRSSIRFAYVVRDADDAEAVRVRGETVCVVMDLDPGRPTHRRAVPLPDDLRARIEAFVGGT